MYKILNLCTCTYHYYHHYYYTLSYHVSYFCNCVEINCYISYRTLVFIENNYKSIVPELHPTEGVVEPDVQLFTCLNDSLKSYTRCMERLELRNGLKHVVSISKHGSDYMSKEQPWRLMINDRYLYFSLSLLLM